MNVPHNTVTAETKAAVLAEVLPYIRRFAGSVFVVKYGGNAMTEQHLKEGFAKDITLLKLSGAKAVGITGRDNHFLKAEKRLIDTPEQTQADIGRVGTVESIDTALITGIIERGCIPVVAPIGVGKDGGAFNINADLVAGKLAEELKAEKLIMMTNTAGVLDKNGSLLTRLTPRRIDELTADGTLYGGMLPKIASAIEAASNGVGAVHIIDGRVPNALLLEVFTDEGVGSMILGHEE